MKVSIGNDHAGYDLKLVIKDLLIELGHEVHDLGSHSDQRADYPDFAHPVSDQVQSGEVELAVLICGSANGVAMAANKHQDVRAAICWNRELATLARQHNNANIICLPARFMSAEEAKASVETFLTSTFEGGRHETRVDKINC